MSEFPEDIYTEPSNLDVDTLKNLGPLSGTAGIWQGTKGLDVKPKAEGAKKQVFVERIELQPIDPQTNGPQLFYGLRYHTHVVKPDEVKTYHDQIGYWLWEPATGTVIQTLTIPRAQIAMAVGKTNAESKSFELIATRGSETYGICSTPFLEYAQDRRIPDQGCHQPRRHLVLRRGHRADDPRQHRALSSHRPQHLDQDRSTNAESARPKVTINSGRHDVLRATIATHGDWQAGLC